MTRNFGVARFKTENETVSQLESHEILFLSGFKFTKLERSLYKFNGY